MRRLMKGAARLALERIAAALDEVVVAILGTRP